ncbi:uncharacterized protein [Cardiocondyla obscurior]|uniref:uncharacterized protein n=1 Tax=Cardiocondyla obscurior TaxID=286306 RepID=UPI00396579EC
MSVWQESVWQGGGADGHSLIGHVTIGHSVIEHSSIGHKAIEHITNGHVQLDTKRCPQFKCPPLNCPQFDCPLCNCLQFVCPPCYCPQFDCPLCICPQFDCPLCNCPPFICSPCYCLQFDCPLCNCPPCYCPPKVEKRSIAHSAIAHINTPRVINNNESWPHLQGLVLADPDFSSNDPIDLILGAEVHAIIIENGLQKGTAKMPVALKTALGWILSGSTDEIQSAAFVSINHCQIQENIIELVSRFWQQEELPLKSIPLTDADRMCEEYFIETTQRLPKGRYMVRLPFAKQRPEFANSRSASINIFSKLKKRLSSQPQLHFQYNQFLHEYEVLGHMSKTSPPISDKHYYLPHHGVFKGNDPNSKLWVQLALDEANNFPLGASVFRHETYMDDILTGADSVSSAKILITQLINICTAGGVLLAKWSFNSNELSKMILSSEPSKGSVNFYSDIAHTILGLCWNPAEDFFYFHVKPLENQIPTKRLVLSETARLFDPLGWLAPVIVKAKILIQTLWLKGNDWDHPLDKNDSNLWFQFRKELLKLSEIKIPRWLKTTKTTTLIELHGFADASERAYAAGHPSKWTTYVANRVSEIQQALPSAYWNHIPGHENPADCASRGLLPSELPNHPLWWSGPEWLKQNNNEQLKQDNFEFSSEELSAIKNEQRSQVLTITALPRENELLLKFSTLLKLLRITALCRRWLKGSSRGPLSWSEINNSLNFWIKTTQLHWFSEEIKLLTNGKLLSRNNTLSPLSPITLHGGPQLTLSTIRQRYWLMGGRAAVKEHIKNCVPCIRWRGTSPHPQMSDLPQARVTANRPFLNTEIDYAGPLMVRTSKGRGQKAHKAFLAIFICFSTRAIHIELVSDYTTAAFLAALRRFISRRKICSTILSDRGTNFVGADKELRKFFAECIKSKEFAKTLANQEIKWKFNPPSAPHFDGIWEAAVKATKHHIRRVIGEATLTFEEMYTLLTQIEACLNSRPLVPLSNNPEDLEALTPGHFLIGNALNAVPEPCLANVPDNKLSR